jgi:hypothetical protein
MHVAQLKLIHLCVHIRLFATFISVEYPPFSLLGLVHANGFFSMHLPAHSGPWHLIQYRNHFSQKVGFLGQVISLSQGLYLNTGQHKHRIKAYTHQTSMPWVGFEPTIPASERVKTVHVSDRAATVTGMPTGLMRNNDNICFCSRENKVVSISISNHS